MKKKHVVRLSASERWKLEQLVNGGRASARNLTRARILLKVDADRDG